VDLEKGPGPQFFCRFLPFSLSYFTMATTTTTPEDKTVNIQQDTIAAYDLDDDKMNTMNVLDDGDRSNTNNDNNNDDNSDSDDGITEAVHGHPLQDAPGYSPDVQDQSDKSLLDAHGSPNVSRSPSALNSPIVTPTEPEVLDASPAKVSNAKESTSL
jgi:hypothetical protein